MKLEFLGDLTDGGKHPWAIPERLIRLYDFNLEHARMFRAAVQRKLIDQGRSVNLVDIPFIEEVNCSLELRIAESDTGITTSDFINFKCDMTLAGYHEMIHMMEPFCDPAEEESTYKFQTYQWLYDAKDEEIDLLFSPGGSW